MIGIFSQNHHHRKMGRPKLNKSKSEANKEYIKKHREKNAENYKDKDRKRKKNKLEYEMWKLKNTKNA